MYFHSPPVSISSSSLFSYPPPRSWGSSVQDDTRFLSTVPIFLLLFSYSPLVPLSLLPIFYLPSCSSFPPILPLCFMSRRKLRLLPPAFSLSRHASLGHTLPHPPRLIMLPSCISRRLPSLRYSTTPLLVHYCGSAPSSPTNLTNLNQRRLSPPPIPHPSQSAGLPTQSFSAVVPSLFLSLSCSSVSSLARPHPARSPPPRSSPSRLIPPRPIATFVLSGPGSPALMVNYHV